MYAAYLKLELGCGNGRKQKRDGDAKTSCVRLEKLFDESEHNAKHRTEQKRAGDVG